MGTTTLAPRGELQTATFPSVVRDLWKTRASGILHVSQGATAKRLMFKNGDIVFAGTNRKDERLGERLLRAGMIKPSVLDLACRVMVRSGQRLGETIVELGFVSPWEMQWWVAEQIKSIIFSVFSWDSGDYHFEPTEEPVEPDLILELKTAEVIWEGARRANCEPSSSSTPPSCARRTERSFARFFTRSAAGDRTDPSWSGFCPGSLSRSISRRPG